MIPEVMKIRDILVPMLKEQGFSVVEIPDNLTLRESIDMVNVHAKNLNDGLAIDIHLNAKGYSAGNLIVRGTEVYSGTSVSSTLIAKTLSRHIAAELGIPDRGYRPDTMSAAGSLGWIRQTNCWAALPECLYLDDPQDRGILLNYDGHTKAALGMAKAICELYDAPFLTKKEKPQEEEVVTLQKRVIELTMLVISLLQKLINLKSTQENRLLGAIYRLWN
jgi:N-acetylmuramoyl-L-alanine amidase